MRDLPIFRTFPLVARWLIGIGWILGIGPFVLNSWAEFRHVYAPLPIWQNYLAQSAAFLLWGIALIITALVLQRREHLRSLFMQPSLWFGLLFLVILPDGIILLLQDVHILPDVPVEEAIIIGSLIACLLCLGLGVYFWWQKRLRMIR